MKSRSTMGVGVAGASGDCWPKEASLRKLNVESIKKIQFIHHINEVEEQWRSESKAEHSTWSNGIVVWEQRPAETRTLCKVSVSETKCINKIQISWRFGVTVEWIDMSWLKQEHCIISFMAETGASGGRKYKQETGAHSTVGNTQTDLMHQWGIKPKARWWGDVWWQRTNTQ